MLENEETNNSLPRAIFKIIHIVISLSEQKKKKRVIDLSFNFPQQPTINLTLTLPQHEHTIK